MGVGGKVAAVELGGRGAWAYCYCLWGQGKYGIHTAQSAAVGVFFGCVERLVDAHGVADLLFFAVAAQPVVLGEHAETFADTLPPTAVPSPSPKPGLLAPLFALLTPQGTPTSPFVHRLASSRFAVTNKLHAMTRVLQWLTVPK
jgi:hypothetical protein